MILSGFDTCDNTWLYLQSVKSFNRYLKYKRLFNISGYTHDNCQKNIAYDALKSHVRLCGCILLEIISMVHRISFIVAIY